MRSPTNELKDLLEETPTWGDTAPGELAVSSLGIATIDHMTDVLSRVLGIPIVTIPDGGVDPAVRDLVSESLMQRYQLVAVRRVGRFLTVAMADPSCWAAIRAVETATGLEVLPVAAAPSAILRAIQQAELVA